MHACIRTCTDVKDKPNVRRLVNEWSERNEWNGRSDWRSEWNRRISALSRRHSLHIYIYIYMYTYIRTYVHTDRQTYPHKCTYTRVYAHSSPFASIGLSALTYSYLPYRGFQHVQRWARHSVCVCVFVCLLLSVCL